MASRAGFFAVLMAALAVADDTIVSLLGPLFHDGVVYTTGDRVAKCLAASVVKADSSKVTYVIGIAEGAPSFACDVIDQSPWTLVEGPSTLSERGPLATTVSNGDTKTYTQEVKCNLNPELERADCMVDVTSSAASGDSSVSHSNTILSPYSGAMVGVAVTAGADKLPKATGATTTGGAATATAATAATTASDASSSITATDATASAQSTTSASTTSSSNGIASRSPHTFAVVGMVAAAAAAVGAGALF